MDECLVIAMDGGSGSDNDDLFAQATESFRGVLSAPVESTISISEVVKFNLAMQWSECSGRSYL